MVVSDPDMPDSFAQKFNELAASRHLTKDELARRFFGAKHRCLHEPLIFECQQSSVQGIKVEEQSVAQCEGGGWSRTVYAKAKHCIGAIAVVIDEVFVSLTRTASLICPHLEMGQDKLGEVGMASAQFPPGNRSIAIAVQADCIVQIT